MLLRKIGRITAILAGEVSTLVVLHRLGAYGPAIRWDGLGRWLGETPPEDAIVVVVRLVALVIAWWLTTTTVLYVLASAARMTTLVRGVRWATLPPVRRIIDGLLAGTVVAGTSLGTAQLAVAQPSQGDPVVVSVDQLGGVVGYPEYRPQPAGRVTAWSQYHPKPASDTAAPADPKPRPLPSVRNPPSAEPVAMTYIVRRGDNLWRIAERHIGPSGHADAVRSYWTRLIEANRPQLISRNPRLIYPGEVIRLP